LPRTPRKSSDTNSFTLLVRFAGLEEPIEDLTERIEDLTIRVTDLEEALEEPNSDE
jgi:hypothetical protein